MTVALGDPGTVIVCGAHFDGRADAARSSPACCA